MTKKNNISKDPILINAHINELGFLCSQVLKKIRLLKYLKKIDDYKLKEIYILGQTIEKMDKYYFKLIDEVGLKK